MCALIGLSGALGELAVVVVVSIHFGYMGEVVVYSLVGIQIGMAWRYVAIGGEIKLVVER